MIRNTLCGKVSVDAYQKSQCEELVLDVSWGVREGGGRTCDKIL